MAKQKKRRVVIRAENLDRTDSTPKEYMLPYEKYPEFEDIGFVVYNAANDAKARQKIDALLRHLQGLK